MTENQEESFLREKEGEIKKALADLPISDKQGLEESMAELAKMWHTKVLQGTIDEMYSALYQCFKIDLKEKLYFNVDSREDSHCTQPIHLIEFMCAYSFHKVGRSGPEDYIAVFHRTLSQEEAESQIRERYGTWGVS